MGGLDQERGCSLAPVLSGPFKGFILVFRVGHSSALRVILWILCSLTRLPAASYQVGLPGLPGPISVETGLYSPLCEEDLLRTHSLLHLSSHEHQERMFGFSQAWWGRGGAAVIYLF